MKVKEVYKKYKEIINYLIFGVLTTLVDFVVCLPLTAIFGADYKVAGIVPWHTITEVIGWIAAVMFAYVTNKIWVFEEKDWSARRVARELPLFAGGRVVTLLIQLFLTWIMIDIAHLEASALLKWGAGLVGLDDGYIVVRAIVAVVVIVLNYVISKLLVFRKKEK